MPRVFVCEVGWVSILSASSRRIWHDDACWLQLPSNVGIGFRWITLKLLPIVVTEKVILVDDSKKMKLIGTYKPWAWKWLNPNTVASKSLIKGEVVVYTILLCFSKHVHFVDLRRPQQGDELHLWTGCMRRALCLLAIICPILVSCKLEFLESLALYNLKRWWMVWLWPKVNEHLIWHPFLNTLVIEKRSRRGSPKPRETSFP